MTLAHCARGEGKWNFEKGIGKMLRPIIRIDTEKCDGCGQCIMDCAEGALAIVDGKARLISESYCDGLGACLNCPKGALSLEMRDSPAFDEEAALKAKARREAEGLKPLRPLAGDAGRRESSQAALAAWPVKLELLNPNAAWLKNAPLLFAADCAGFASPEIRKFMSGKALMIACPKLGDRDKYTRKLAAILEEAKPASLEILRMSVPCCGGLERIVEDAQKLAGTEIPVRTVTVNL